MEEEHKTKVLALEEREERVYIGEEKDYSNDFNNQEVIDNPKTVNIYNTYVYNNTLTPRRVNKLTALLLCLFFGPVGAHKFYEGKVGMGILYLFTGGLFLVGWIVDIVLIAMKPDPYYIYK